jgi:hypothetical protein
MGGLIGAFVGDWVRAWKGDWVGTSRMPAGAVWGAVVKPLFGAMIGALAGLDGANGRLYEQSPHSQPRFK